MYEEEQQPSDQYLIQRFRSNQDFTHRDFGICDVKIHKSSGLAILQFPMAPFIR
jgi:hypothetical protein